MPQFQQKIELPSASASDLIILAFGTFQQLGWTAEFSSDERLIGYTKKKWNSYYDHILVDAGDGTLTITSKLPDSAVMDMMGRNKKNVHKFLSAWENIKSSAPEQVRRWQLQLDALNQHTVNTVIEEQKAAKELDAVMHLSTGSKTITYAIIGVNVLVFICMIATGVGIMEPTIADLTKWGANFKPYTVGGDWWRLLTSIFIHIGIIHIAFNMFALFQAGIYLEPMLGKWRYIAAYLCTGILASVASTWWHGSESVSAGASGAIFGLYGVFLALLTTNLIPKKMRTSLLQSIGIFVFYNLAYGARSGGVDNSAHLGGLISGFIIGYIYFISFKNVKFRPLTAALLVAAVTIALTVLYLKDARNDDAAYQQKIDLILQAQDKALAPINKTNVTDAQLLNDLVNISSPQWQEAKKLIDETASYHLDTKMASHRGLLKQYIELRIKHTDLLTSILKGNQSRTSELEPLIKEINEKVEEMKKYQ